LGVLGRYLLDDWLGSRFPFALAFYPVLLAAWWRGTIAGLACTAVGTSLACYLFIEPRYSILVAGTSNALGLALFIAGSVVTSLLGGAFRRSHDALQRSDAALRSRTRELQRALDDAARSAYSLQQQRAVSEQRSRELQAILDVVPIGIAISDGAQVERIALSGDFQRMLRLHPGQNASATGPDAQQLPFRWMRQGVEIDGRDLPMQVAARTGKPVRNCELDIVFDDGDVVPVLVNAAPVIDDHGRVTAVVAAIVDVRMIKQAEHALREADRVRTEFLAMLAHELRNPLAPIRSAAEIMRLTDTSPDSPAAKAREAILRQVAHLTRLVDDLLDVSRTTLGKVALKREPVAVCDIIDEALEAVRPLTTRRRHTLTVTRPAADVRVDVDPTRAVQIVTNLLSNAAKFTPDRGKIEVEAHANDRDEVVLRVRDSGIGVPAELQRSVFELFRQEKPSLDRSQGGLGIGLTLAKSLVEAHGGRIELRSDGRGKGTEVSVTLPAVIAPHDAGAERRSSSASRTGEPARVLIVEDNVDAADTMRVLLTMEGHDVRVAGSGADALKHVEAFAPDLALVDLGLPGMTGLELAERLRAHANARATVLVALSGYAADEDVRSSSRAGFAHHLAKPVAVEVVLQLVAEARAARPASSE
jgi:signal transduction histidine kinase/ActR/RegA family two-component response regulator